MDLRKEILEEHSRRMTTRIVNFVGHDRARFRELADLFLGGDPDLSRRASWPLGDIGVSNPGLVKPYIGKFVKLLNRKDQHPAIPRHILRILMEADIPERHCAEVYDLCCGLIRNESADVAIRANAISVAARIVLLYPDLSGELRLALGELSLLPLSPALKQRTRKALAELSRKRPA